MWGDAIGAPGARRDDTRAEPAAISADADARAVVKAYLRLERSDEDALIDGLIASAIGHCEGFVGRLLPIRQVQETVRPSPCWRQLGCGPVRSVTLVESLAPDGSATTLSIDSYAIDIDAAGDGWVRIISPDVGSRVRVTYAAGIANGWGALPEPLRQGVMRLAAHLYAHRDAADEGAPPTAIAALWRPWRRMRLS